MKRVRESRFLVVRAWQARREASGLLPVNFRSVSVGRRGSQRVGRVGRTWARDARVLGRYARGHSVATRACRRARRAEHLVATRAYLVVTRAWSTRDARAFGSLRAARVDARRAGIWSLCARVDARRAGIWSLRARVDPRRARMPLDRPLVFPPRGAFATRPPVWRIKSRALRERRLEKIWTLEQLAKQTGLSARTLGDLEKSDRLVHAWRRSSSSPRRSASLRARSRPGPA